MFVYICTFILVIFLTYLAQLTRKKYKYLSYVISFISIIVLSLIAAFRSNEVGTDIKVYGLKYFEKSQNYSSLYKYLKFYDFSEPLYFILNYIVYNIYPKINLLFFVIQFFLASIIYIIAYRNKNDNNMVLYIFTYLCIWYNTSFNIIRQSLAIFIVLYGFKYLENNDNKKYCLCIVLAFFFHKSSVLCLLIPLLKWIAKKEKRYIYIVGVCFILFVLFGIIGIFIPKLISMFPTFEKYFDYALREETNFMLNFACIKLVVLIGLIFFTKETRKTEIGNTLIFIAILDFVFYCSSLFIMYGYRMSYIFLPHYIYLIPRIDRDLKNYKGRSTYRIFICIALMVYWYYRYVKIGYDGTIPYTFFWK